jgi:hypothetical protein
MYRPKQDKGESLQQFHLRYNDWINMHGFIEDNSSNLTNKNELDCFSSTSYGEYNHGMSTHDRNDPTKRDWLTPNQIVHTLNNYNMQKPKSTYCQPYTNNSNYNNKQYT